MARHITLLRTAKLSFGAPEAQGVPKCGACSIILQSEEPPVRYYNFEIVIEKEAESEGYSAYSPSLAGCFSNGKTIEEAKRNMREAITQHVETLLAHGQTVP